MNRFYKKPNPKVEKKNDRKKERKLREQNLYAPRFEDLEGEMRLNRFIALAGICSRRDADVLIRKGKVQLNGKVVTELGIKVTPGKEKVVYNGKELRVQRFVYLLMNKPKNQIVNTKDDRGRDTVMELVGKYTKTRVYPVARLDRNATGLLLFTNDGEMAKKLTHPSHEIKKLYQVKLNKELEEADFHQLKKGVDLEDGQIKASKVSYIEGSTLNEVAIQLTSDRNRVVRRMFEHLGYQVDALDRVGFGPLTKKKLPRGTCRFLEEKEVGFLRMLK
ncbi:MAG TPA: rRNA pseudouridine synthase [Bacteroidetes bacterium]|nr:rRNA pseudouridine synthase [Bacteroidota bacterium]